MRSIPFLLASVVLLSGPVAQAQTPVHPALAALLQQKLDSCKNVYEVPGISCTILLPGDRFWNGATGVADIYTLDPLDTAHVFQAASTTKLFTATVVFQLIEEGLLTLDDSVGAHLPPMTNIPGDTKLRYLLNHRSGIGEYLAAPGSATNWFVYPDSVWPPAQVLQEYNMPPDFVQNTSFAYSNTNYHLLGLVIEAVTGNTYADELSTRILQPLGLTDAYLPPLLPVAGNLTPGWSSWSQQGVYDEDVTPVLADCFASFAYAAGAMVVTPNVLARFNRALMSGSILTPASIATMRTCTNVNFSANCTGYGHGTMRYVYSGRTYYGHSGDINGFTQMTMHSEPDSVTFALSINRDGAPRGPIAAALLGVLYNNISIGVNETSAAPAFELFPVPAAERFTLRSEALLPGDAIELHDATGRLVRSERATNAHTHTVDVQGLVPGAYQLRWPSVRGVGQRTVIVAGR